MITTRAVPHFTSSSPACRRAHVTLKDFAGALSPGGAGDGRSAPPGRGADCLNEAVRGRWGLQKMYIWSCLPGRSHNAIRSSPLVVWLIIGPLPPDSAVTTTHRIPIAARRARFRDDCRGPAQLCGREPQVSCELPQPSSNHLGRTGLVGAARAGPVRRLFHRGSAPAPAPTVAGPSVSRRCALSPLQEETNPPAEWSESPWGVREEP